MPRVAWFVTALLASAAGTAAASPPGSTVFGRPDTPAGWTFNPGTHTYVEAGPENYTSGGDASEHAVISNIIYLNRNGGTYTKSSINDAIGNSTIIGGVPQGQQMTLGPWALSEATWTAYVACMREVYQPYDVQIVTEDPGTTPHHEAVVAGRAREMMIEGALGIAPLDSGSCQPKNNVISFTFANDHGEDPINLCWTTAQESAHSFGLDHAYYCPDALTYMGGCGQKYFRNRNVQCGEFAVRPCVCGGSVQNSHGKILSIFGNGTNPVPGPMVSVVSPMPGSTVPATFSVFVNATDRRGVSRVELYINGWKWTEKEGAGPTFVLDLPGGIPDGVMNLQVRAYNDLEVYNAVELQVTRGAPCDDAASDCLAGQKCEAGACFWDPPTTALGEACEFPQQCLSLRCDDAGDGRVCTEACFGPPNDECPDGFECNAAPGGEGLCRRASDDEGGCCSTGGTTGRGMLLNLGLGAMIGLLVLRRRRRPAVRA